jgi:hypothetical protein
VRGGAPVAGARTFIAGRERLALEFEKRAKKIGYTWEHAAKAGAHPARNAFWRMHVKLSNALLALGLLCVWPPATSGLAQAEEVAPAAQPASTDQPAAAPDAAPPPSEPKPAAAPAAAARAAPAAEGKPVPDAFDGGTYAVRLRDLEARVDELKEQIRRSHTRLSLLSDTILSGGVGGARAEIVFKNDLSGAFRLSRALFVLDGAVQYNKQDESGALAEQEEIPIFKGSITPGDHTLQVLVKLRGHGYGVFSYLRGYQFEVKSTHSFSVTEGKEVALEVIAWEKGGVTTPLEQRPAVRYLERLRDVANGSGESGDGAGGGK